MKWPVKSLILASAPYMKWLVKSSLIKRIKIAPRTPANRENRRIDSLAVWPFGGAQFSGFWDGNNSLQDDGTEAKPVFGCISLS